jgi:uncharacterized protein DUF4953/uncharacterized protein DUF5117/uncharacterized protein DUF5118
MRPASLALLGVVTAAAGCSHRPPGTAPTPSAAADSAKADSADVVKPYAKVITAKAVTQRGLVITHRISDKLYFELPRGTIGPDLLLVNSVARASAGQDSQYGGDWTGEHVVRWEQRGHRVLLRSVSYTAVADSGLPVARAVRQSTYAPVIASLPIEAFGADSAPVIDVTKLYTTNIPELAAVRDGFDDKRSFIERVLTFPDNVEIEATQTATDKGHTNSVLAHWSMVRLPAEPMVPRRADARVGYFTIEQTDYGAEDDRAAKRSYIGRWRLVKKDPAAAVSDPVTPIVFYIDPATPQQWVPWIKKGIENWQPAFEAAGFSNAIVAREVPASDTSWSPDDVRHTVVRWLPSTVENAYGPQVVDPRTGEVLNGSVRVFHNVLNLLRDWYIVQAGAVDPRTRAIPLPDTLMGRLLQFVIEHEVGHTLGLRHNMLASSEYPADSVRSRSWTHRMGHTPSIMDYARFNYVAQPEDSVAIEDLVPRIGLYDVFAIHWGYAPVALSPGVGTPGSGGASAGMPTGRHASDAERPVLDAWARVQDSVPWLRFAEDYGAGPDPGVETEAVGDADAVRSTALGFKNIARIVPVLMSTAMRPGESDDDLRELYDRLVAQWQLEIGHVVHVVGGVSTREKSGSQPGPKYWPVPAARQRAAVAFLEANVFRTPTYLLDPALMARLEPTGAMDRVRHAQARTLAALFDDAKIARLTETRTLAGPGGDAYDPAELFASVRQAVWSEASAPSVRIDGFRRNLQREYLVVLDEKLNAHDRTGAPAAGETDVRALARGELVALLVDVRRAIPRAGDHLTRVHLEEVAVEIDRSVRGER